MDEPLVPGEGIILHEEMIDIFPANIELSGLEGTLVNTIYAALTREVMAI